MNSIGSLLPWHSLFSLFSNIIDCEFHAAIVSRNDMNISFDTFTITGDELYNPANFLLFSDLFACLKNENDTRYNAGSHLKIYELK
jgi:hypothetical protein